MATLGELRNRVLRLLDDPDGANYTPELQLDAICAAHDAILPWQPKTEIANLAGNSVLTVFALPTEVYEVEACVVRSSGENLPQAFFIPGKFRGAGLGATNDWLEYPHGQLTFSKAIPAGETYDVYYTAHWSHPDSTWADTMPLEPPEFVMVAMSLYAASYAILPAAVSVSEVRQWATKVDSGTPEHNPMQKSSDYLLKLFIAEIGRHPRHQRAQR